MNGPAPEQALSAVRRAVRDLLAEPACAPHLATGTLFVAMSGGADSLALTYGAARAGQRAGLAVTALVVDHGLQPGSAEVAATAADAAREVGADDAAVLTVEVTGPGGPEAAARRARYSALRKAREARSPESLVLLGHTRDDQAETVLLGLGRGSGPRSLAGMRALDPPWARPLLAVPRETTVAACGALGVEPWIDPHNSDPRFTRVRLRTEVLPLLEDVLGGGVAPALARTAAQLRDDVELLDTMAADLRERARSGHGLDATVLATAPAALRRRTLRSWLLGEGVPEVTDAHLRSVDALVGAWRGQGEVWLPGNFAAYRTRAKLSVNEVSTGRGD